MVLRRDVNMFTQNAVSSAAVRCMDTSDIVMQYGELFKTWNTFQDYQGICFLSHNKNI
jgi:hypothetical protein